MDCKYGSLWGRWYSSEVNGSYGLIYLNLSGRVDGNSLNTVDLRWRMVPRLDFGMTCGVGKRPLR